jgi:hypothetical protein
MMYLIPRPCLARQFFPFSPQNENNTANLLRHLDAVWNLWMDIENRLQELVHNLILALLASFLDLFDLEFCILAGVLFSLLIAACVLRAPVLAAEQVR